MVKIENVFLLLSYGQLLRLSANGDQRSSRIVGIINYIILHCTKLI